MAELIIQYLIIVALVVGIGYIVYFLKEKGVIRTNDYYGITYTILGMLRSKEADSANVKKILRVVSQIVHYVDSEYKNENNSIKEEKALKLSRDAIDELNLISEIDNDSIRFIIRLSCALGPVDNKIEG
jgi:hypothetical protein